MDAAVSPAMTPPSEAPAPEGAVPEKRCIITGDVLTEANDSKAHVIPSALGGRLKPPGILSKDANTILGDKIDLPFIQAFQALMTWLNGSRDRGDNRPTRMTDESGKTYLVKFGKPLELTKPEFSETATPDGTVYKIAARNLKEANAPRPSKGPKSVIRHRRRDGACRERADLAGWHAARPASDRPGGPVSGAVRRRIHICGTQRTATPSGLEGLCRGF